MKIKTTLNINKELLKQVKDIAFGNETTQNEVIVKFIEYGVNNDIKIK